MVVKKILMNGLSDLDIGWSRSRLLESLSNNLELSCVDLSMDGIGCLPSGDAVIRLSEHGDLISKFCKTVMVHINYGGFGYV